MHSVSIPRGVDGEVPCCAGSDRFGKYEQPATANAIRMTLARTISPFSPPEIFPWPDDVFARAGDSIAIGSAYLLPVRPPPKDSGTRVTPFTRPSPRKYTTRISGANHCGLKRHSQTSPPFI